MPGAAAQGRLTPRGAGDGAGGWGAGERTTVGAHTAYRGGMCRNIRQLHNFEPPATRDEVSAAALQYVRKVSGSTRPSKVNEEAFALAVREVAEATQRLLDHLTTQAPPKDREVEAARAKARAAARYGTA